MSYICKKCGQEFDTLGELGGHSRKMHGSRIKSSSKNPDSRKLDNLDTDASRISPRESSQMELVPSIPDRSRLQIPDNPASAKPVPQKPVNQAPQAVPITSIQDISWIQQQMSDPLKPEEIARLTGKVDNQMAQMQEMAKRQQQAYSTPPPPPDDSYLYRQPNMTQQVVSSIDWNGIAQTGMNLLSEIIKERRMSRMGPSMAETVGQLAIQNFAGTLAKERGRAVGKKILDTGEDDAVSNPVMQGMLQMMQERMQSESKERKDMADKWSAVELELRAARERLAQQAPVVNAEYKATPQPDITDTPAAHKENVVLEVHEQPSVPQGVEDG